MKIECKLPAVLRRSHFTSPAQTKPALLWIVALVLCACHSAVRGQEDDQGKRIKQLVRQLDNDDKAKRDEAMELLMKSGASALPHLPPIDSKTLSAEQIDRLRKIIVRLWRLRLNEQVAGSKIVWASPPKQLKDALTEIQKQTGMPITDMREKLNLPTDDASLSISQKSGTLWEILDQIKEQLKLEYYLHGEDRQLAFTVSNRVGGPVYRNGAFRFEVERIYVEQRFDVRATSHQFVVQMNMMYEPKLQPVIMEIDPAKIICKDDKGRSHANLEDKNISVPVGPESCVVPLFFKFRAPPRDATKIQDLSFDITIWMPANSEQVEFENLKTDKPVIASTAGLRVEFKKMEVEDTTWKAIVEIEQLTDEQVGESFLQAVIKNELWLQKNDGTVFKVNGGKQQYLNEPKKWGAECLFVDAPGKLEDYKLVVKSPTGISPVPIKVHFKDIVLP